MVPKTEQLRASGQARGLQLLGGPPTESRLSSGSTTRSFVGPVQVEDKKANAILGQQLKTSKVVAREKLLASITTTK